MRSRATDARARARKRKGPGNSVGTLAAPEPVGVLVGVLVVETAARSAVRRATKASVTSSPLPPIVACAPPVVPGKFADVVNPATYTSPDVGWIARAEAASPLLPPR